MTDKTLQERLRLSTALNGWIDYEAIYAAADALDAQEARIKALEGALRKVTMPAYNGMGHAVPSLDVVEDARALLGEK